MSRQPQTPATPWNTDLVAHYRLYRDYVEHEDDLINHRSTWHHTIQGLLFAALGITLQWKADPLGDHRIAAMQHSLMLVLPVLGAAIGIAALVSVIAATRALDNLSDQWRRIVQTYPAHAHPFLPELTGAGSRWAIRWGKTPSIAIPIGIVIAWLVLLTRAIQLG